MQMNAQEPGLAWGGDLVSFIFQTSSSNLTPYPLTPLRPYPLTSSVVEEGSSTIDAYSLAHRAK